MDKLGKISLFVFILGIITLLFISKNFNMYFNSVNDMIKNNKNRIIKLEGNIINSKIYNETLIINMKSKCFVDVIYYDKNKNFDELNNNQRIIVKGSISNEFNPSIFAETIELN